MLVPPTEKCEHMLGRFLKAFYLKQEKDEIIHFVCTI